MVEPCIQVQQLTKKFSKRTVLQNISLDIPHAKITGLLGPSGAGKTTLIKLIAGMDTPDRGKIHVLSTKMPSLNIVKRLGYMAQSDALYTELTAYDNLDFFAQLYGLKGKTKKQRINEVMELVDLTSDLRKKVSKYSGGMKRRLSLAIALVHQPEVLLLDEPTVGIDPVLRQSIWSELELLSKQGTTIIVTTHVMDEAEKCHQLAMLRDGEIIAFDTPNQLMKATEKSSIEDAFLYYGGAKA
ncbi:ABC transporter ATP-binding protein [Chengkuizengella axinellae]|uniref:ABC transporter ATP-binding protein n=1 Tax=Chengkuizengella axinellae TaxID=3064388 RepID=A0ABT9IVK1_9BACL|nr:ABC transporter ATP-binding protein [Chengkuizengella sp. 2205SS18-9]MDP5273298.1 ABC transporter ATP-binding protein [Chengkuizengella sp. 2205SS18-9]